MIPCSNDAECVSETRPGSTCTAEKFCSSPYANGGCLANRLTNWTKVRVCNSQDPPEALELGHCRESPLDYTEIRIGLQNWESATFVVYAMQILLSELLDVPTSVETSFIDAKGNFYDPLHQLNYGWSDDERALNRSASSTHGDCVEFTTPENETEYLSCSHLLPETMGSSRWTPPFIQAGVLEPTYPMGELGREGKLGIAWVPSYPLWVSELLLVVKCHGRDLFIFRWG